MALGGAVPSFLHEVNRMSEMNQHSRRDFMKTTAAVIEGFGLSGYGAHSNDAEYVKLETIVPRLYLSARMIMDVSQDKVISGDV